MITVDYSFMIVYIPTILLKEAYLHTDESLFFDIAPFKVYAFTIKIVFLCKLLRTKVDSGIINATMNV